jgi:hypothetical protein
MERCIRPVFFDVDFFKYIAIPPLYIDIIS